jgi:hypothetical protein
MTLRPHHRRLVVWSSSGVPGGRSGGRRNPGGRRPTRARRIRWWLRTGALLMAIGVLRLARTARARWEPVALAAGVLLMVAGYLVPSVAGVFFLGQLVLCAALLKGIKQQRGRNPAR